MSKAILCHVVTISNKNFTFHFSVTVEQHLIRNKYTGFPGAVVKNSPVNAGDARDVGSIPELGRSPEIVNGNPL